MEGSAVVGLLMIALVIAVYFLPMFVAIERRHRNAAAIVTLNILLGWTFLGWVAALVWALTNPPSAQR